MPDLRRLKKRREFLSVAASGNKFVTASSVIQYMKSDRDNTKSSGIGFTVTKKQGNAVKRNHIKRRLREAVRLTFPEQAMAGYDYVLIGRWKAAACSFDSLKGDIEFALKHIKSKEERKQNKS